MTKAFFWDGQWPMRMDQTLSPGNPPVLHCGVPWPPWHLGLGAGGGLPFQMSELLEDKDSGGWGWGSELSTIHFPGLL